MTDWRRKYKRIKTGLSSDDEDERVRSKGDDDVSIIAGKMRRKYKRIKTGSCSDDEDERVRSKGDDDVSKIAGKMRRKYKRIKIGLCSDDEDERVRSKGDDDVSIIAGKVRRKYKRIKTGLCSDDEDERVRSKGDDDVSIIVREMGAADLLPPDKVKILANLIIQLRHDILPQHQVETTAGTRAPSEEEQTEFRKYEPSLKKGSFSPEEDQIIVDNWKAFCKMHGWSSSRPKPFLFHRHQYICYYMPKLDERKKFVQFLADGLPNRSLYSVYHRFRNLYYPHKVNKYESKEDDYIIKYIEENESVDETRKFADLAKVLKRTRASVWRRYKLLKKKRNAGVSD